MPMQLKINQALSLLLYLKWILSMGFLMMKITFCWFPTKLPLFTCFSKIMFLLHLRIIQTHVKLD